MVIKKVQVLTLMTMSSRVDNDGNDADVEYDDGDDPDVVDDDDYYSGVVDDPGVDNNDDWC